MKALFEGFSDSIYFGKQINVFSHCTSSQDANGNLNFAELLKL